MGHARIAHLPPPRLPHLHPPPHRAHPPHPHPQRRTPLQPQSQCPWGCRGAAGPPLIPADGEAQEACLTGVQAAREEGKQQEACLAGVQGVREKGKQHACNV
eukprot:1146539-Pelagomonas_calceolata.AAC.10